MKSKELKNFVLILNILIRNSPIAFSVQIVYCIFSSVMPSIKIVLINLIFSNTGDKLIFHILLYIIVLFVVELIEMFLEFLITKNIANFKLAILKQINGKALKLGIEDYEVTDTYDLLTKACNAATGSEISGVLNDIFWVPFSLLSLIMLFFTLAYFNWIYILIAFLTIIPVVFQKIYKAKVIHNLKTEDIPQKRKTKYLYSLLISANSVRELRAFGAFKFVFKKYLTNVHELHTKEFSANVKTELIWMISDLIKKIGYVLAVITSIFLLLSKRIKSSLFATTITSFETIQDAFDTLLSNSSDLKEEILYIDDIFDFINLPTPKEGKTELVFNKLIEFENVSYMYPQTETFCLKNLSFKIDKGENILIVGENGSGKSTLIKLLCGLYTPTKGRVLIDNLPIQEYSYVSKVKTYSGVFQNFNRYYLTLLDNIILSRPNDTVDLSKVRTCLSTCNATNIVDKSPLNSQLGLEYDGYELSGGEWQKIALCRGLYKSDAAIQIFDEATSSIDPITENKIIKTIINENKLSTCIFISHKLWLGPMCDKIIVMAEGCILEMGSHSELMQKEGKYYELYSTQKQLLI